MAPALVLALIGAVAAVAEHAQPQRLQLSARQLRRYERDGVILVRGLLTPAETAAAQAAAAELEASRSRGFSVALYSKIAFQQLAESEALRHVALRSRASAVAAQLIAHRQLDISRRARAIGGGSGDDGVGASADGEVRVLKDAFLSAVPGKDGCGWHRDDSFFWPCPEGEGPGVNVWIALSDYRPRHGGGLAVSAGSYRARWRDRAIAAISGGSGAHPDTCGLERLSPALHRRAEARRVEWRMRPGDAIVHDRYCFHRGVPFTRAGLAAWRGQPLLRYSIRYMPADATLDRASGDPAVRTLGFGGRTLRSLGWRYPRCWPDVDPAEEAVLRGAQASRG